MRQKAANPCSMKEHKGKMAAGAPWGDQKFLLLMRTASSFSKNK
jgi:hypothetical protein